MTPFTLPQPKFNLGEVVLVSYDHRTNYYEDCPDCFNGSLKVIGPKGESTVICKKCNGSGHGYKIVSHSTVTTIDAMLEISGVIVEVGRGRLYGDDDGVTYRGKIVWREDIKDNNSNIFPESRLSRIE